MKPRKRNVSDDRLAIMQRNTENGRRENSLPIPDDLTMVIFSRLPAKSTGSCRCVSKPLASILRRSDFTELFLTRSSARPLLLFACQAGLKLYVFSSPQPQSPNENSSPVVVNHYMKFSFRAYYQYTPVYRPVQGLLCHTHLQCSEGKEKLPGIFNLSTGQSLLLPKVKTNRSRYKVFTMLGYDPIGKQFKLLSMTLSNNSVHEEHQVLTLGTRNHTWRMIDSCRPHYNSSEGGICINGVLYYKALDNVQFRDYPMVVCFDVRSENFRFIHVAETVWDRTLVNYNGKLGLLGFKSSSGSIELCVLEDSQSHEWSKHTYVLPVLSQNIVGNYYIVGMTRTNEIVLAPNSRTLPFYVFYYNIERKTIIRLQYQGMEQVLKGKKIYISLDHVEDLKLMELFNSYFEII